MEIRIDSFAAAYDDAGLALLLATLHFSVG